MPPSKQYILKSYRVFCKSWSYWSASSVQLKCMGVTRQLACQSLPQARGSSHRLEFELCSRITTRHPRGFPPRRSVLTSSRRSPGTLQLYVKGRSKTTPWGVHLREPCQEMGARKVSLLVLHNLVSKLQWRGLCTSVPDVTGFASACMSEQSPLMKQLPPAETSPRDTSEPPPRDTAEPPPRHKRSSSRFWAGDRDSAITVAFKTHKRNKHPGLKQRFDKQTWSFS